MRLRFIIVCLLFLSFLQIPAAFACHKGGPMGFASQDPVALSTDYTSEPTFITASTSGTSGCENWDLIQINQQEYLAANWEYLVEDAAQGNGKYLTAFSQVMGCSTSAEQQFSTIIHANYQALFHLSYPSEYERTHLFLSKLNGILKTESLVCQSS